MMIEIDNKIVSEHLFDVYFACDYEKCKGICCVEGESGAPLAEGEADELRKYLPQVEHLLSDKARKVIAQQGVSYMDDDGDEVTSIIDGKDCVFTTYDEHGNGLCAYELMHRQGLIDFCKPISCRLYPIRLTQYPSFTAVNYHKWEVCKCALKKGRNMGMPLYRFLEEPLRAAFGDEWYEQLEAAAQLIKNNPNE